MDKSEKRTFVFWFGLVVLFLAGAFALASAEAASLTGKDETTTQQQTVTAVELQDLGEFHVLWQVEYNSQTCLLITGGAEGSPAEQCFTGLQSVNVFWGVNLGSNDIWLVRVALQLQPDRNCHIVVGNSSASTPIFACSAL